MAQDAPADVDTGENQSASETQAAFLDLIHSALASGIPVELVQEGLKYIDVVKYQDIREQFASYINQGVKTAYDAKNCQSI